MSNRLFKPRSAVCRMCDFITSQKLSLRQQRCLSKAINTISPRTFITTSRKRLSKPPNSAPFDSSQKPSGSNPAHAQSSRRHITEAELAQELRHGVQACSKLLSETVPSEKAILNVLHTCRLIAADVAGEPAKSSEVRKDVTAAASLLSLADRGSRELRVQKLNRETQFLVDELSQALFSIVSNEAIFISPEILELYISAQSCLGKPETFPGVFYLYANKPIPVEGSRPIQFKNPNPNKVNNAIPIAVADQALQTAIDARELDVAMDIIDTAYAQKAFRRAKFIRKGLLPATGLAIAPIAAYGVASQLAMFQNTMEPGMATNIAFAGILAYMGFTTTIGVVAVTTANDQMDRVTWAPGMPLRERWIREEERAAIDKVAGSWGFHEKWRRGEEEGKDWDRLRLWIGNKGMLLDAVELMEGME
ncbi:159a41ac-4039-43bd-a25b-5bc0d813a893 [Sclerotinia trifoliorum]|uniref:159a41ac-4039-43bd-a25b-5bc0d813a893 n=1 Tax=Sclerotinia trifoliorum TaxID=28548 RepID=A0A8H2VZ01_9HELO|nr:159a41ac-4039-43bd-a25b-5bc0d813a893 [Sclerotinia trifoliorum]